MHIEAPQQKQYFTAGLAQWMGPRTGSSHCTHLLSGGSDCLLSAVDSRRIRARTSGTPAQNTIYEPPSSIRIHLSTTTCRRMLTCLPKLEEPPPPTPAKATQKSVSQVLQTATSQTRTHTSRVAMGVGGYCPHPCNSSLKT